jgi:hypothetical protein
MKLKKFLSRLALVAIVSCGFASTATYAYPIYGNVYLGGWGVPYYAHIYYGSPYYGGPFYHAGYFPYRYGGYYPYQSNYHYHYVYNYNINGQHYHYVYNYNYHNRW